MNLSKNIAFLRNHNNLSQADIQDRLGFKRNTWSNWENGISEPNIETLSKIAHFFGVQIDDIINFDFTDTQVNQNNKLAKNRLNTQVNTQPYTQLNAKNASMVMEPATPYGRSKMPHIVTVNESGIDNIIFVPVKAQAGYLLGYGDQEFIESLPSFRMPGLTNATFRMFEAEGLSMSPTLSNRDKVIGEWVPSIAEIRENRVHVMVLKDGVVIKRVLNRADKRGKLYLKSDTLTHRQDYPIREIEPSEIIEIWYVRLKVSGDLSEPSEIYSRLADVEINQHQIMKKLGMK